VTDKYQEFQPLDLATFEALKASIKVQGVINPVIVDQDGDIIDGFHRMKACEELGVQCPTKTIRVRDDEDGRDLARQLNAIRRHLSLRERVEVINLLRSEGHSLRAIAKVAETSEATVRRTIAGSGGSGASHDAPRYVKGSDGKKYPPKKPAKPKPPPPQTIPGIEADKIVDTLGKLYTAGDKTAGKDFRAQYGQPHDLTSSTVDAARAWVADRVAGLEAAGGVQENPPAPATGEPQERATADAGPDDPAATATAARAPSHGTRAAAPRSAEKERAVKVSHAGQAIDEIGGWLESMRARKITATVESGARCADAVTRENWRRTLKRLSEFVWQLQELTKDEAA
jgi:hypothetical protein